MKILIAEDDLVTRDLLKEFLETQGHQVVGASDADVAFEFFSNQSFDLTLSDIRMGETSGLELLKRIKAQSPDAVVVLMTGFGDMEGAIEAIKNGAFDYLSKPFDLQAMIQMVEKVKSHLSIGKSQPMQSTPEPEGRTLIGRAPQMVEVYKMIAKATLSDASILITGESGTGKELVARAIHEKGPKKTKPFVALNMGAFTESLLESELFGYVKGAFTGANFDKKGLFQEANGGTLFLDEIGDLPLALQVKLLRVLQENEVRPVGSSKTYPINVRVIAATHRDLNEKMKRGEFREDLYYRLKVIEIHIPALKERTEDLSDLANTFLRKYSKRHGKEIHEISPDAMKALQEYPWPGNVRELEHQIERAVALSQARVLLREDFDLKGNADAKDTLKTEAVNPKVHPGFDRASDGVNQTSLESLEKEHILKVLKDVDYHKSKAAEILGIDRATLYRKATRYGISLKGE